MGAEPDLKTVGTRTTKVDGPELVTGRGVFAEDVRLPGMLHGRVLHSPHAHARIRRIDVSRALKLEGVVDVITSTEAPGMSLFADGEVCYEGHKVAAVAAEDPDIAEDALELIRVDYEALPAVTDPAAAMAYDAPLVRLDVPAGEVPDAQGRTLPN
ncbi:MAG: xanthine dehydrogenase family protein molybdopterin-binding subunit, partial [Candidatus Latescibacteria bacterium]|nr:xanthine dehydrogenase family protein molybdopterin-binding subunit [Candidatus Latescibacterota bacterium]